MYDFRLTKDQEAGAGYKIFCDSCGQTSLSSHGRYCPVCGRGTLTPITVTKIGEEKKAYVTFRVDGRYVAEIPCGETINVEDVIKKAVSHYENADFGVLSVIDGEPVMVEDDHGNYLWEK